MAKLPGTNVLVLDLPNKPKTTRKRGPITRTGCKECKRRHIKCDEAKPACRRCVIAGLACDVPFTQVSTRNRDIKPRLKVQTSATVAMPTSDYRILAKPDHLLSMFKNQQNWDLFSAFILTSAQAGTVPINTLSALTPQIAHGDPIVREVCCAVGAAAGVFTNPTSDPLVDEQLSRTSLMHYNRAVSAIREAEPTTDTLLTVAVASILFVTYDLLQGDLSGAFVHFNHGRRVAESYFDRRCKERGLTLDSLPLSSLESALCEMVQRLTTYPWALELGLTSSRTDHKTDMYCHKAQHRYRLEDIPTWFRDLSQALTWWDVAQHYLHYHDLAKDPPDGEHQASDSTSWGRPFEILQQWHNSFSPLLQSARQNKAQDPYTYLSSCILEALYLQAFTNLHLQSRPDSNVLPDSRSIYLEIIQVAREMQQKWEKSFSISVLDNAVARPLIFVLFKCRDAAVRQEIQELLSSFDGTSQMALPLLAMVNQERGKELSPKLRNVERSLGWYLTACGCNSGGSFN